MTPEKKYYHKVLGFNYRMTSMQAAPELQIKKLNLFLRKKQIKSIYKKPFYKKILQLFH